MNSRTSERFRLAFGRLPARVQTRARAAYRLFRLDPSHPSLRFKQVHPSRPIYSVRVGLHYRALGVAVDEIVWFWVDRHEEYEKPLARR